MQLHKISQIMKPFFCFFLSLFCFVSSLQAQTPTKNDFGVILEDGTKIYNIHQQSLGTLKAGQLFNALPSSKNPEWCVVSTNNTYAFVKQSDIALFTGTDHIGDVSILGEKYQVFNATRPIEGFEVHEYTVTYPILVLGGKQCKIIKTLNCCSQSRWDLSMNILHATQTESSNGWFEVPKNGNSSSIFLKAHMSRHWQDEDEEKDEEREKAYEYKLVKTDNGDIYAHQYTSLPLTKATEVLIKNPTPVYASPDKQSKVIANLDIWDVAKIISPAINCATKISLKSGQSGYILSAENCGSESVFFFNSDNAAKVKVNNKEYNLITTQRYLTQGGSKIIFFAMSEDNWAKAYPILANSPSSLPKLFSKKYMEFTDFSDAPEVFCYSMDSDENNQLVLKFIGDIIGEGGFESFNYYKLTHDSKGFIATEVIQNCQTIKYRLD
jgi:hypothetical protein